jgi:hypothetical protein
MIDKFWYSGREWVGLICPLLAFRALLDQCMRNYGPGSELVRRHLQRFTAVAIARNAPKLLPSLQIVSPACFERFWEEISQLPPPPDMDAILVIAKKDQLEIHAP